MRIGTLSKRTGVSVRMLRNYEGEGLLAPERTGAGYRDYTPLDEDIVRRIRTLGAAGMTLPVIREFLPCALAGRGAFEPCDELRQTLRRHIEQVDERITELATSRRLLESILATM
ncbi:HTH-type transcriptional regulator YfmP [Methylobacterium bullatum]|uniref:HTH-type transcriptional regulator YfmP n=1 Tax=Methylobacterium bullatum TaxID=570505 RepID=A0A679ITV8_9HYPH|nr:HTH-type transcriptional regulator YfmP [Methylobacterium bullatum]